MGVKPVMKAFPYQQDLSGLVGRAKINTLIVMTMQVACCAGLLRLAKSAGHQATPRIAIGSKVVSLQGDSLSEKWCESGRHPE